jgi:hypothetical protein
MSNDPSYKYGEAFSKCAKGEHLTRAMVKSLLRKKTYVRLEVYAYVLNVSLKFYEDISKTLGDALQVVDSQPLRGITGKDELTDTYKNDKYVLCQIDHSPEMWMYDIVTILEKTIHARRQVRARNSEILRFDRLGWMTTDNNGIRFISRTTWSWNGSWSRCLRWRRPA